MATKPKKSILGADVGIGGISLTQKAMFAKKTWPLC